jgi:putative hydrolase of the HAD superfamily
MPVEHVLLDADGVLQDLPGGWYAAMEPHLGDRTHDFFQQTWAEELPMLAGQGDYLELLGSTLRTYGVTAPAEEVFADVWHRIDPVEATVALVRDLRATGYGVHLATNQERHRAAHMRVALGYDELFDVSCYSYELGVAKPDPRFFTEAVRRIGTDPARVLFIDDNEPNVLSAREAGLLAEHWHFERGHGALLVLLAGHGVRLPAA